MEKFEIEEVAKKYAEEELDDAKYHCKRVIELLSKDYCIVSKDVVKVLYDSIRRNGNMPIEEEDKDKIASKLTVLRSVFGSCGIDWNNIPEYD